ncbi:MAG: type II toxin-antitoxin system HicA family toxin [Acidobacteriia bacterium]|nr:type II toxin-antitoxin system HicA family toxin [Terriglobia bacterium]
MKLPRDVSGAEAVRALERMGFSVTRQVGSHVRLRNGPKCVTVPLHRSLAPGTLQGILRQAATTLADFLNALR